MSAKVSHLHSNMHLLLGLSEGLDPKADTNELLEVTEQSLFVGEVDEGWSGRVLAGLEILVEKRMRSRVVRHTEVRSRRNNLASKWRDDQAFMEGMIR